jgi:hypothetical protein
MPFLIYATFAIVSFQTTSCFDLDDKIKKESPFSHAHSHSKGLQRRPIDKKACNDSQASDANGKNVPYEGQSEKKSIKNCDISVWVTIIQTPPTPTPTLPPRRQLNIRF